MEQLRIVSNNIWLEALLKQYSSNLDFITNGAADLTFTEQDNLLIINLNSFKRSWQLAKPLSILLLINIIEQAQQILAEEVIIIGPVQFYPNQRLCKFEEEEINLTQKEAEILLHLAKHPEGLDKATFLNEIWGYSDEVSTHTLETHIYKLRNKFANKYELILSKDSCYALSLLPGE